MAAGNWKYFLSGTENVVGTVPRTTQKSLRSLDSKKPSRTLHDVSFESNSLMAVEIQR